MFWVWGSGLRVVELGPGLGFGVQLGLRVLELGPGLGFGV